MSILDLYNDFGIPYQTEGHKHCRPGWANLPCPFCTGNPGLHLGSHIGTGRFYCWRCGWKPTAKALSRILSIDEGRAKQLMREYSVSRPSGLLSPQLQNQAIKFKPHRLPTDCGALNPRHKKYLEKRGFDPEEIEEKWGLLGTGPVAELDGISYKHRILAPIYWGGKQASFQTRDITGKSSLKYLACPKGRERVYHKELLYGREWPKFGRTGVCVEGITDVWRFGPPAFAVFGIEFTNPQVRAMAKMFSRVIVVFDDDPQAIRQGQLLVAELQFRGVEARQEIIKGDPADMPQAEAGYFLKQLL